jgi:hypothetical protein
MKYIENPKTKGSGIIACIPQTGRCPNNCEDCFFQSGRSYLEPLDENLPNMPPIIDTLGRVVRVNDGNDSNVDRKLVIQNVAKFPMRFYNTAINSDLGGFDAPVVLTVNPGGYTDRLWHKVEPIPKNLMFVRVRTNMWNLDLVDQVVDYYTKRDVPVVLTFMAYFTSMPSGMERDDYSFRKRTINSYWAINTDAWRKVMRRYEDNILVYSCGRIEGERGNTKCRYCGNCLREYFATMERTRT